MMSQSVLADQLLALEPADEAAARANLAGAYATYAADAEANAVPITSTSVSTAQATMATALIGMSAPGIGLTAIPAAIRAFWSSIALGLAASFPGATAITPPPHAGLEAAFATLMAANTAAALSKEDATAAMAALLHPQAVLGGTVTFPGPVTAPIV